jgi:hypothetical protein
VFNRDENADIEQERPGNDRAIQEHFDLTGPGQRFII